MFTGDIEEVAAQAQELLARVVPGAVCVAQEWDGRIDCLLGLPDGTVAGEMLALADLTEDRLREVGERLRRRAAGIGSGRGDTLRPPTRIVARP